MYKFTYLPSKVYVYGNIKQKYIYIIIYYNYSYLYVDHLS